MPIDLDFKNRFAKEVEKYVSSNGGTYIDAVIELCEEYEIEPEVAAKSLNRPIIEKIQIEGGEMNMLPTKNKETLF